MAASFLRHQQSLWYVFQDELAHKQKQSGGESLGSYSIVVSLGCMEVRLGCMILSLGCKLNDHTKTN